MWICWKGTGTGICIKYKNKNFWCQSCALQIKFTTNTVGNTLKEDKHRENHISVIKPAAFAANVGFQYEILWFDSFGYPSK